jgi:ubiquinone/menaquinone biosynthesis C-methylase UbiE
MSAYDSAASSFDLHRALEGCVPIAIRTALLSQVEAPSPRLLDLGAGTGRIGRPFAAAGDDYVGVDLSLGMLREFARRAGPGKNHAPRLAQADGECLPFGDATFDAVMMIQVMGAARSWRRLVTEALRVLRSPGTLAIGHTDMPADGLDARMKHWLASLLDDMGVPPYHTDARRDVQHWLESVAQNSIRIVAAEWDAERTPRGFLDRQPTGAQFSRLPKPIKDEALRELTARAIATFGSLDAVFRERHALELNVFKFQQQVGR